MTTPSGSESPSDRALKATHRFVQAVDGAVERLFGDHERGLELTTIARRVAEQCERLAAAGQSSVHVIPIVGEVAVGKSW